MIDTPMKLATPPIWPSNVYLRFVGQGMFVYDNPLTINGTWHAGPQQIFMPTNAAATLSGRPRIPEIYTEWFGAPANGIDDDSVATLLAFNASSMMGYIPVKLLPITYRWAQQILGGGTPAVNFFGVSLHGTLGTIVNCAGLGPGVSAIKYRGGSGRTWCRIRVTDIEFEGDADTIAVEFSGQDGAKAFNCRFGVSAEGVRFSNIDTGAFTEYSTAEGCQFDDSCVLHMNYVRTNGNDSFHGSGMGRRCTSNRSAGKVVTHIGPGCKIYNSPVDVQVWATGAVTLIQNDSTLPTSTHGLVTYETSDPNVLTLGAGNAIDFVGDVMGTGIATAGTLTRMDAAIINADSSVTAMGARKSYKAALTTGANVLPSSFAGKHRDIAIQIEMSNYDYRYTLSVDPNGYGGAGKVTILSTDLSINNAGYGAPVLSVDAAGHLVLTNANWPATGLQCVYSERENSGGAFQEQHEQTI
jgi:hypothetical protein